MDIEKLHFCLKRLGTVIRLLPLIPDSQIEQVYREIICDAVTETAEVLTEVIEVADLDGPIDSQEWKKVTELGPGVYLFGGAGTSPYAKTVTCMTRKNISFSVPSWYAYVGKAPVEITKPEANG